MYVYDGKKSVCLFGQNLDEDLPDEYKQLRYSKWTLLQLFSFILILAALTCTLTIPFCR